MHCQSAASHGKIDNKTQVSIKQPNCSIYLLTNYLCLYFSQAIFKQMHSRELVQMQRPSTGKWYGSESEIEHNLGEHK